MKKIIHLIRHAKSSWDDSSLADIDRPLNQRGKNNCRLMASPIVEAGCDFQQVYCSPAVRAQSTIRLIANALSELSIQWHIDSDLYTFYAGDLLNWVQSLSDEQNSVVIIGHNPAITELTNLVSNANINNVATCGYVQISFDGRWHDLGHNTANVVTCLKPKMFK